MEMLEEKTPKGFALEQELSENIADYHNSYIWNPKVNIVLLTL